MSWAEWEKRYKEAEKKCEELIAKHFPKDEFDVKDYFVTSEDGKFACVVDFKKKYFEPFDCDDYCDQISYDEEEYEDCINNCKENLETALTSSVKMLLDGTVLEATIAGDCRPVWSDEWEEEEEFEKRQREFYEKWEKAGCQTSGSWIHPHELIGGAEWEEYPATCFYHMTAKKEGTCKIDKVFEIMKEVW